MRESTKEGSNCWWLASNWQLRQAVTCWKYVRCRLPRVAQRMPSVTSEKKVQEEGAGCCGNKKCKSLAESDARHITSELFHEGPVERLIVDQSGLVRKPEPTEAVGAASIERVVLASKQDRNNSAQTPLLLSALLNTQRVTLCVDAQFRSIPMSILHHH